MSTISLPERIPLPADQARHNLAIATIAIYGLFLPAAWVVEYSTTWNNWTSKSRRRTAWRVAFVAFFDFISLLCISTKYYPPTLSFPSHPLPRRHGAQALHPLKNAHS